MGKTLSVLMTNYNHEAFLPDALQSILSQSYTPLEIIIIDSGSTDNSWQIIESYCRDIPHAKIIRQEKRQKLEDTINALLMMAKGDYICYVSSDDMILPGFLAHSMSLLNAHPQAGYCCTDDAILYQHHRNLHRRSLGYRQDPGYIAPHELDSVLRRSRYIMGTQSIIFRRDVLIKMGGWHHELLWQSDDFAKLVIAFRYGICYVPKTLSIFRYLHNSVSNAGIRNRKTHRQALAKQLALIYSETYQDVRAQYKSSDVMARYGLSLIWVILSHRKFLPLLSVRLLCKCLYFSLGRTLKPLYMRLYFAKEKHAEVVGPRITLEQIMSSLTKHAHEDVAL